MNEILTKREYQVVKDNEPAYKSYESIGFEKEYSYWYMRKESTNSGVR